MTSFQPFELSFMTRSVWTVDLIKGGKCLHAVTIPLYYSTGCFEDADPSTFTLFIDAAKDIAEKGKKFVHPDSQFQCEFSKKGNMATSGIPKGLQELDRVAITIDDLKMVNPVLVAAEAAWRRWVEMIIAGQAKVTSLF
ncbi:hypothetical protein RCL1_000080 [Eukaryota sp. TZLM3-RCL]